jgi:flagellar biosynthesis protein FlhF
MKLKSYFSGTVEAAMELARQELGDEALLVNARPATPETRALGAFEVVFGVLPPDPPPASPSPPSADQRSAPPATAHQLSNDVAGLKREMERLVQSLGGAHLLPANAVPEQQAVRNRLLDAELDLDLVERVAQGAALEDLFQVDATLGRPAAARAVVALVGPPGAGKTTTLVKLAARYGLASRRPAQFLSSDVFRIAAADQLRSLAAILGIGCTVAETPVALAQALEEHRAKDFVFIDTPGLGRRDMEDGADLARLLASHPEIDVHLVLPASMKPADLREVIDRYQPFRPGKLLFTRTDESGSFGMLINESVRRGLPISFLATGQQIPDDLEPATKEGLCALVYGQVCGQAPVPARSRGAAA